tara:strand:- start:3513 stop:4433 length:921 start_codon:yes stop_codon:yes gene_type:complete
VNLLKPNFWKKNSLIVFLLLPFTLITRLIIFFKSINISYKPNISTICVGNIYLGGTGKTQLVLKLDEILKRKYKTFVIKKYYRNQIDEQKLLAKNTNLILPSKRIDGIKKIENSIKNLAIFDDGLQDKSIKYSTSIVCFSSISGVGNGKILPAGPLREDLSKLKNYNMVFINGKKNTGLIRKIKKYNRKIKIFSGKYYLKNKKEFNSKSKYLAFCGIGTPENFFYLLQENGIKLAKKIIFPDHFNYKNSDIIKIKELASKNNLRIVTTEKDYMKVKKYKNFKTKFTNVDLNINNISNFKNFLIKNL